ncbi:MAG: FliA/WhiG family RNA polymerase sigma factor [Oceanipulchritudo sp.]
MAIRHLKALYSGSRNAQDLSEESLEELALRFLPIVRSEVARFKSRVPRHVEADDLHGVAIGGLMRALERGEDVNGERFGAYVRQRVRGAILDELRKMDVYSRSVRRKAKAYDEALQRVEQREGRVAGEAEIRAELGLTEKQFNDLLEELRPISFLSIDKAGDDEGDRFQMADHLEDVTAESIPEKLEGKEVIDLLNERLKALPQIQQRILHMYYFKDFCLAEIAEVFKLSESRICQLHTHAIRGLRAYMDRAVKS